MVKIDIISGFLGAGKTTFANRLLEYYIDSKLRPVYIVNEFGQTGLDAEIVRSNGFKAVEMQGGCICCTLKDDVAATLTEVIDTYCPTNIVFEPSGIFIFDHFYEILKTDCLAKECELGNIFTIVDSTHFDSSKAVYGSFIYNQIKNSPVIVLSKLEKSNKNTEEIICDIRNINADALIVSKPWSQWSSDECSIFSNQYAQPQPNCCSHHHDHLQSMTVRTQNPFTQVKIDQMASCCKEGRFGDIYRVKGVVKVDGKLMAINIVAGDIILSEFNGASEPALTFIGHSIQERKITRFIKNFDVL